jgi:uncharacterized protein (TIGR02466 family)
MSEMLFLFPTPVAKIKFRSINTFEKTILEKYSKNCIPNVGNNTSANNYVLNDPELAPLKEDLDNVLTGFYDDVYKPFNNLNVYTTQSWMSVYSLNSYHHAHKHYNSILSAVLYINAIPGDSITFLSDFRPGIWMFSNPSREENIVNQDNYTLPVEAGDLVIFPSWLSHKVERVEKNHNRLSLAMNSFIKGKIGSAIHLNELEL